MNRFVEEQITVFRSLVGQVTIGWLGIEMALRESDGSGRPLFHDPAMPFLQMSALYILTADDLFRVLTYQSDDWGLQIEAADPVPPPESHEEGSIFRTRRVVELPLGLIKCVSTVRDDKSGDLVEVRLNIDCREVVLQAGEVYEDSGGQLSIVRPDESILVSVASA